VSGANAQAKAAFQKMDSFQSIVGYMNNKAVMHSKLGHFEEGTQLYSNMLETLPDSAPEIKAVVTYNLALAKIREKSFDQAEQHAESVIALGESRVLHKAKSLSKRLKESKANGTSPILLLAEEVGSKMAETTNDDGRVVANAATLFSSVMELAPGDICCYRVYSCTLPKPDNLKELLSQAVTYRPREAIQRGEGQLRID
jgi:tetratricopeptide (TPR) repeat protein